MTYQQTLDYLYTQLPMFSRIGSAAYKADLSNTIILCDFLNNPQHQFKTIHVAGTNGKGSTSHMLAAILQHAGYKTGLYTSPHLKDFRERIKVDGEMITEEAVVEFAGRTKKITEALQPSFFELTVAMAFEYFAAQKVDVALIEAGLGGRLDSTNVIMPILSVITNIGYDHMDILGNTLEEIASEKAGIIKQNTPVVIGEYLEATKPIFLDKATKMDAPIYFAQEQFTIHGSRFTIHDLKVDVEAIATKKQETFTLDLNGLYQTKNLMTVLSATKLLKEQGFVISDEAEKRALANTKKITGLHGRWETIHENPIVVLDVAHNEDGIQQLLRHLSVANSQLPMKKIHFVIGFVKDKDVDKALSVLPKNANYYFTNAHIPRALPAGELKDKAAMAGLRGNVFDDVNEAIGAAKQNAATDDLIIVCGSVFLIGEVD